MRALGPYAALREAWRIFASRPFAMLSLGAALFISLVAVCCGLGVLAAPWFMCELFALQIGSTAGESPRRTTAWIAAGFVQLSAVLVLSLLALAALLALGPDVLLGAIDHTQATREARLLSSSLCTLAAGACTIALTVHFQYAPALLIERGGTLFSALLDSARLVAQGGFARTWMTSVAAHTLPWLAVTLTLTAQFAVAGERKPTLAVLLLALPVLALSNALGQGMIIANYLALRSNESEPARPPRTSLASATPLLGALSLLAATPLLLLTALLKPAPLAEGELAPGSRVVLDVQTANDARELYLPDSALRLVIEPKRLAVMASDGGGAGVLPLPTSSDGAVQPAIVRVRVARNQRRAPAQRVDPGAYGFAIEVRLARGVSYVTAVDDSGVRLDDSLQRRSMLLLPPNAELAFALSFAWLVAWSARLLPRLAQLARASEQTQFARTLALLSAVLAAPALLCFGLSLWALLR